MAKTITYFISGHRDISQEDFNRYYVPVIEDIINGDLGYEFIMGDCDGADLMAQEYLHKKGYGFGVYHMFKKPRNCVVDADNKNELDRAGIYLVGGFQSDEERDAAMTRDSNSDIAFIKKGRWKSGTAKNILRRYERDF